ncbi:MAG TPA: Fur family transcriptional regulator [Ktedonobacterales bacterium]
MTIGDASESQRRFSDRLRRLGVRVTPQRLLVLEALTTQGGHLTADEVMRWTVQRYPGINLATVYRTLDLLVSVGVVAQTNLGGGAATFELVGDSPHHHLVCERCGAVMDFDDAAFARLRERIFEQYGFRAHSRHIALFGVCQRCLAVEEGPAIASDGPR